MDWVCIMRKKTAIYILNSNNQDHIARETASCLNEGGICIIPTDTIYGIVAIDDFSESIKQIYQVKNRPESRGFIRLIGELNNVSLYTHQVVPPELKKYWPGPLTIIFRGIHQDSVALRCPDDPFLGRIFDLIDHRTLVAPSANISGSRDIFDCKTLRDTFEGKVDIIVCSEEGPKSSKASTIVDISGPVWKIIREGALKLKV